MVPKKYSEKNVPTERTDESEPQRPGLVGQGTRGVSIESLRMDRMWLGEE